ncbi:uncharacterized protein LOC127838604 isoform X2 [Dreissena polymorpha]|uniref:uncharacterized protein LOC127838604 isoform X2 n=1 Tax=Dreissena polymorpha TaxID=45954 RepID=UPI002263D59D|nr:uncharacterized protein LOC127838604 isoform X2 [Dreissena polymorpha]
MGAVLCQSCKQKRNNKYDNNAYKGRYRLVANEETESDNTEDERNNDVGVIGENSVIDFRNDVKVESIRHTADIINTREIRFSAIVRKEGVENYASKVKTTNVSEAAQPVEKRDFKQTFLKWKNYLEAKTNELVSMHGTSNGAIEAEETIEKGQYELEGDPVQERGSLLANADDALHNDSVLTVNAAFSTYANVSKLQNNEHCGSYYETTITGNQEIEDCKLTIDMGKLADTVDCECDNDVTTIKLNHEAEYDTENRFPGPVEGELGVKTNSAEEKNDAKFDLNLLSSKTQGYPTVSTDKEINNWFKACIAINITKVGLTNFVKTEMQKVHVSVGKSCGICSIENVMSCPTSGLCKKKKGIKCTFHQTKSYRQCHTCEQVKQKITSLHRFQGPSWKNTKPELWISDEWEIAKCFLPPDGYNHVMCIQKSDFNGVISVILNCKYFETCLSSTCLSPPPPDKECFLEQVRQIGRDLRHIADCKLENDRIPLCEYGELMKAVREAFTQAEKLGTHFATSNNIIEEGCRKIEDAICVMERKTHDSVIQIDKHTRDGVRLICDRTQIVKRELEDQAHNAQYIISEKTRKATTEIDMKTNDGMKKLVTGMGCVLQAEAGTNDEIQYERGVKEMLQCLKPLYERRLSYLTESPLDDCVNKRLVDYYMQPNVQLMAIDHGSFKKTSNQITKYKDLFFTNGHLNRQTFMQGEAGTGKTCFLAKLVLDWCNMKTTVTIREPLSTEDSVVEDSVTRKEPAMFFDDLTTLYDFKFVFYMKLRDCVYQHDVSEMIKEQLLDAIYSKEDREEAYKLLNVIMKRELCLILLDGLDEFKYPAGIHALPTLVASYSRCTLFITTRPWTLVEGKIKYSEIEHLLQLEGIHDPFEQIKIIIGCMVDKDNLNAKHCEFISYIREKNLVELMDSPMMLSLIVDLWAEGARRKRSTCEIYSLLLESLLKKANSEHGQFLQPPFPCFTETNYIKPNLNHVQSIAEAAFCLLFTDKRENPQLFGITEMTKYNLEEHEDFALRTGFLSVTKTGSLIRASTVFSFIHKGIQEFLAACHIACNTHATDDIITKYLKRYEDAFLDFSQVFIFLCGLNISAANELSYLMNNCAVKHYPKGNIFQRIIISGFREAVSNKQKGIFLHLSRFDFDESNWIELLFIWLMKSATVISFNVTHGVSKYLSIYSKNSSSTLRKEILNDLSCPPSSRPDSSTFLKQAPTHGRIDSLDLLMRLQIPISHDNYKTLKDIAIKCRWEELDLSLFESLESINISKDVNLLPEQLRINTLKRIELQDFDLTTPENSLVRTWCLLNAEDPAQCVDSPPVMHSLEHIRMKCVKLTSSWLQSLFSALLTFDHRVACDLWDCDISSSTVELDSTSSTLANITMDVNNSFEIQCHVDKGAALWESLEGLSIKNLRIRGVVSFLIVHNGQLLSKLLSTLTQIVTLRLYLHNFIDIEIPKSLRELNLYFESLSTNELHYLVNKISHNTQPLECRLEFACAQRICNEVYPFVHIHEISSDDYVVVQQELTSLHDIEVKRFQVFDRILYNQRDNAYVWSVRGNIDTDEDHHHDYDIDDDAVFKHFLQEINVDLKCSISMRFLMNGPAGRKPTQ